MKKRYVFIFVTTLVFMLISCGIPTIYVPSSGDITLKSDSESGNFTVSLSSTVTGEMASGYPYIYFVYTVSSESQSSAYSSSVSAFNTKYCTETGGAVISSENGRESVASYTSGSGDSAKTYGIFQFSNLTSYQISDTDSITLNLIYSEEDGTLTLADKDGNVIQSGITRSSEKKFTKTDFETDHTEIVDYEAGTYSVKVYALVSCVFNAYNNIYNTKLSYSSPVLEFKIVI